MAVIARLISSSGKSLHLNLFAFVLPLLLIAGVAFSAVSAHAATPAEQGQAIFEQKCKGCHAIGGGRLVGPDLKGVTANRAADWLVRFITAPDKVIAAGDSIAQPLVREYGLPMPNLGVTDDQAKAILAYIDTQSTASKPAPPVPTQIAVPTTPVTTTSLKIDADAGKNIFTGRVPLTNGGPACLSCHNISAAGSIGGGTVGNDLTRAYSTMGEAAIGSILKTTPFPMMKQIYTVKPLTDEEIASLLAFLKSAGSAPSSQNTPAFFIIGGAGGLLIIGLFQWLWRGRLAGVRRPLVKGGSK